MLRACLERSPFNWCFSASTTGSGAWRDLSSGRGISSRLRTASGWRRTHGNELKCSIASSSSAGNAATSYRHGGCTCTTRWAMSNWGMRRRATWSAWTRAAIDTSMTASATRWNASGVEISAGAAPHDLTRGGVVSYRTANGHYNTSDETDVRWRVGVGLWLLGRRGLFLHHHAQAIAVQLSASELCVDRRGCDPAASVGHWSRTSHRSAHTARSLEASVGVACDPSARRDHAHASDTPVDGSASRRGHRRCSGRLGWTTPSIRPGPISRRASDEEPSRRYIRGASRLYPPAVGR